jgi:antitoxin component of MazEF toxin-antitoxin module
MKFKAKLRRIGNSQGIYVPKEVISNYNLGDEVEFEVLDKREVITKLKETIKIFEEEPVKEEEVITNEPQIVPMKGGDWNTL